MKKGDLIYTPRFCTVEIEEVFESSREAYEAGYTEPTHYHKDGYGVLGKTIARDYMAFAGYKEA